MQDLIEKFSLEHLNPSPAAINFSKLDHFNGLHIRNLSREDLAQRLAPYLVNAGFQLDKDILYRAIPIICERLVTLDDVVEKAGFFFKEQVTPNPADLVGDKLTPAESAEIARKSYQILASLPEMSKDLAEPPMRNLVEESGLKAGQIFGILRVAVTGQKVSPPLFESMEIIGKSKVLERIQAAIDILQKM
jgi:glutamyl-tRNA synthetase